MPAIARYVLITAFALLALAASAIVAAQLIGARAHEHQVGESAEERRVVDFLRTWHRPKGIFNVIQHRVPGCCYAEGPKQDCFRVLKFRNHNGIEEVFPETTNVDYQRWYPLDTGVNEEDQPDPRESPDGQSYVCILGQQVACFVRGAGL